MTETLNVDQKNSVRLRKGEQMTVTCAASSTAQVDWRNRVEGAANNASYSLVASESKKFGPYVNDEIFMVSCLTGTLTIDTAPVNDEDQTDLSTRLGTLNQPASGSVTLNVTRQGFFYRMDFTLNSARISVTDGAGSGSYGSLKLFDFAEKALTFLGCRQNYTAFAEGAALTTAAGDAAFKIGVGSVAKAAAADGALAGANDDDIGGEISVTLSGGTGTGTGLTSTPAAADGTATAKDLNLNWSGTAATIDANSTIDVTGTITVLVADLGDD